MLNRITSNLDNWEQKLLEEDMNQKKREASQNLVLSDMPVDHNFEERKEFLKNDWSQSSIMKVQRKIFPPYSSLDLMGTEKTA